MTRPSNPAAHWTFSAYYFASISIFAFGLGYLPLHCESIGFSAAEIAAVSAVANLASILASPSSLQLAHRLITPRRLLVLCIGLSLLAALPLFVTESFIILACAWAISCFCKRAGDALVDAQAIRSSAEGSVRFERARSWGSLGFVVVMYALGVLNDSIGRSSIVPIGLSILCVTFLASMKMKGYLRATPEPASKESPAEVSVSIAPKFRMQFLALLLSVALIWASHSILYVYLSLYLSTLNWNGAQISLAWNIGVLAEIAFFFAFKHLEHRISLKSIYLLSIAACLLRWLILFSFDDFYIIMASQVLHGLTFGACYVSSMKLTHAILPEHLKDRGQGLLYGFGIGVGALTGRLHAGYVASGLPSYRDVQGLFFQSFVIALVALVVASFIRPSAKDS